MNRRKMDGCVVVFSIFSSCERWGRVVRKAATKACVIPCDTQRVSTKKQEQLPRVSVWNSAPTPQKKFIQELFLLSAQPCIIYFEFFSFSLFLYHLFEDVNKKWYGSSDKYLPMFWWIQKEKNEMAYVNA